jgi:hypothetical protein
MARGSQEGAYQGSLYYASVAGTKEGEQVRFELTRPNPDDKKNPIKEGSEKKLTGYLVGAQHRVWNYQDRAIDSIVLTLNDPQAGNGGETYRLELSAGSSIGRSIMNSLLKAENFMPPLTISLYNSKDGGYANVGMYLGGDRLEWKYSFAELSKYITKTTEKVKDASGKLVTKERKNYLELNEFLINEFKTKVVPMVSSRKQESYSNTTEVDSTQPASVVEDNDLPF